MRRVDVVLLTVSRNSSKCFLLLWIPWSYHQYSHQFFYQPVNPSELFYQHHLHPSVLWELLAWMHHSHTIKEHQFILSNALILHFLHIFFKQIRIIACTTKIWKAETGSYIISKMFIFYVTIYLWHVNRVRYFIEGNGMLVKWKNDSAFPVLVDLYRSIYASRWRARGNTAPPSFISILCWSTKFDWH